MSPPLGPESPASFEELPSDQGFARQTGNLHPTRAGAAPLSLAADRFRKKPSGYGQKKMQTGCSGLYSKK